MSDIANYLHRYYRTTAQLSADCAMEPEALRRLVDERLVPAPSYSVSEQGTLLSKAFGEFLAGNASLGDYFHPANASWVARAVEARERLGAGPAHHALKARFQDNFALALRECDRSVFRLPDCFTDTGQPRTEGLQARTREAWEAFLDGIYSLCVADPSSEMAIARKEVLQEALVKLGSDEATWASPDGKARIGALIEQYAQASMPFSPLEYARSSRKRLVDDFREKLAS
ncbi:DUF6058 family natural product biosynthesis protein [Lysobacter tyrosinilyticus]